MKQAIKNIIRSGTGLILLAYIAFISLGLPDGLLGVAWPSIRAGFSLSLDSLGALLFASTTGYLASSFFSGRVISRMGVGWLLAASCAATGAGLVGYTLVPSWWMMLALAVVAGLGAGAIDAGINNYAAANFGEHQMQWLHASFGIGITMGPVIMTAGINLIHSWRLGYSFVGISQIILAACFAITASVWKKAKAHQDSGIEHSSGNPHIPLFETLRQLNVWISILLFFIYAGIEASLGSWAYTFLTEARGIAPQIAGLWVGSYWAAFTIGRILAGLFTRRVSVHTLIRLSLLAAFFGTLLLVLNSSVIISLAGVAVIGFSIAPVFPAMVSGTIRRVHPKYVTNTIGMQISAAGLGVAILPGFAGYLAQRSSLEVIPVFLLILTLLLFGLYSQSVRLELKEKPQANA